MTALKAVFGVLGFQDFGGDAELLGDLQGKSRFEQFAELDLLVGAQVRLRSAILERDPHGGLDEIIDSDPRAIWLGRHRGRK